MESNDIGIFFKNWHICIKKKIFFMQKIFQILKTYSKYALFFVNTCVVYEPIGTKFRQMPFFSGENFCLLLKGILPPRTPSYKRFKSTSAKQSSWVIGHTLRKNNSYIRKQWSGTLSLLEATKWQSSDKLENNSQKGSRVDKKVLE